MSGLEPSYENIIKQELGIAELKQAYHALMKQAVSFAETITQSGPLPLDVYIEVKDFLASPEVRTWREQEGKK